MAAPNYSPSTGKGTRVTKDGVVYMFNGTTWQPMASAAKKTVPTPVPTPKPPALAIGSKPGGGYIYKTAPMSIPAPTRPAPNIAPTPPRPSVSKITPTANRNIASFSNPYTVQKPFSLPGLNLDTQLNINKLDFSPFQSRLSNIKTNFDNDVSNSNPNPKIDKTSASSSLNLFDKYGLFPNYQPTVDSLFKPQITNTATKKLVDETNTRANQYNLDVDTRNNTVGGTGEDIYGLLGDFSDINVNGTEDEYINSMRDSYRKKYDFLNERARSQDPIIRAEAEKGLAQLETDYTDFKKQADDLRVETEQNAGESIRANTLNNQESQRKLANVYSSLGSADSSQFMEQLAGILRSGGDYAGSVDRSMKKSIADIGNTLLKYRGQVDRSKEDVISKRDELLRAIQDQLSQNELGLMDDNNSLLQLKWQRDIDNKNRLQNLQDSMLLNKQNNLNSMQELQFANQLQNSSLYTSPNYSGYIPTVLAQELQNFDALNGWGPVQAAKAKQLLGQYANSQYEDLIKEVIRNNQ